MNAPTPTILLIDNDDGLVAAIAARLEHYGYGCVTAGTGAQGLAAFKNGGIDLVITDLNMPVGNGIALITSLRETSDVPVIVVTGYRVNFRRELAGIPNVTVIEKPFDSNQLIDLIEADLVLAGHTLPTVRARRRAHAAQL